MRQHGSLRPARGARGIEEPSEIIGRALDEWRLVAGNYPLVLGRPERHDRGLRTRPNLREFRPDESDARTRMRQDEIYFGGMELGIDRNGDIAAPPSTE